MAGFDEIAKKAQGLFDEGKVKAAAAFEDGKEKFAEVRTSDKAEQVGDNVLGGLASMANKVTGGKYADKIESVRDAADKKIGPGSAE